jgi:hypothetical protein
MGHGRILATLFFFSFEKYQIGGAKHGALFRYVNDVNARKKRKWKPSPADVHIMINSSKSGMKDQIYPLHELLSFDPDPALRISSVTTAGQRLCS